jgi:hypothetical protein
MNSIHNNTEFSLNFGFSDETFESHQHEEASTRVMPFPAGAEYEFDSLSNPSWIPSDSSHTASKENADAIDAVGTEISSMEQLKKTIEVRVLECVSTGESSDMEEEIQQEPYFVSQPNAFSYVETDIQTYAKLPPMGKFEDYCNDSSHSTTEDASSPSVYEDHRKKPRGKRTNTTKNPEKNTSAPIMLIIQRAFNGYYEKKKIELEWTFNAKSDLSSDLQLRFGDFIGGYDNLKTWSKIREFVRACKDQEVKKTLKNLLQHFLVESDQEEFRKCLNTTRLRDDAKTYLENNRQSYYKRFVSEIF